MLNLSILLIWLWLYLKPSINFLFKLQIVEEGADAHNTEAQVYEVELKIRQRLEPRQAEIMRALIDPKKIKLEESIFSDLKIKKVSPMYAEPG
jgi:hypothetical protein